MQSRFRGHFVGRMRLKLDKSMTVSMPLFSNSIVCLSVTVVRTVTKKGLKQNSKPKKFGVFFFLTGGGWYVQKVRYVCCALLVQPVWTLVRGIHHEATVCRVRITSRTIRSTVRYNTILLHSNLLLLAQHFTENNCNPSAVESFETNPRNEASRNKNNRPRPHNRSIHSNTFPSIPFHIMSDSIETGIPAASASAASTAPVTNGAVSGSAAQGGTAPASASATMTMTVNPQAQSGVDGVLRLTLQDRPNVTWYVFLFCCVLYWTIPYSTMRSFLECSATHPQIRFPLHACWQHRDETVIDNEGMGRKSSKRCCIFHKPRAFGESSTDTSDYDSDNENAKYGNRKKIAHKKNNLNGGSAGGKKKTPDHLRFHAWCNAIECDECDSNIPFDGCILELGVEGTYMEALTKILWTLYHGVRVNATKYVRDAISKSYDWTTYSRFGFSIVVVFGTIPWATIRLPVRRIGRMVSLGMPLEAMIFAYSWIPVAWAVHCNFVISTLYIT